MRASLSRKVGNDRLMSTTAIEKVEVCTRHLMYATVRHPVATVTCCDLCQRVLGMRALASAQTNSCTRRMQLRGAIMIPKVLSQCYVYMETMLLSKQSPRAAAPAQVPA